MIHERATHLSFLQGGFADLVRVGSHYRWHGRWHDVSYDKPTSRLRFLSPPLDNPECAVVYARAKWSDRVLFADRYTAVVSTLTEEES